MVPNRSVILKRGSGRSSGEGHYGSIKGFCIKSKLGDKSISGSKFQRMETGCSQSPSSSITCIIIIKIINT